jgi:hypothetical protein
VGQPVPGRRVRGRPVHQGAGGARRDGPFRPGEVGIGARRVACERPPPLIYDRICDLPVEVDSWELEGLSLSTQAEWTRRTTVIHLHGGGEEGIGEDVTYDEQHQLAFQRDGLALPVEGSHTIDSFSELVAGAPGYQRWGLESAALDLALRQAGTSLTEILEREPGQVGFVVSFRLGDPPSLEPVRRRLELYPRLHFKLDPESAWTEDLVAELAATGAVDVADLKGMYHGTVVDQPPNPELYRLVAEGLPEAFIEDPALTPETEPALEPHRDRITWDAPIHSVADIDALPFPPKTINVKPSRFGSLSELLATYDYLAENGMGAYGGGQYELGPGRGQIEYLASLFHADAPNDVAPVGYHGEIVPGLPESPLQPAATPTGFRWE